MITLDVFDPDGNLIGYRCTHCKTVVRSLWGETCNRCVKAFEGDTKRALTFGKKMILYKDN